MEFYKLHIIQTSEFKNEPYLKSIFWNHPNHSPGSAVGSTLLCLSFSGPWAAACKLYLQSTIIWFTDIISSIDPFLVYFPLIYDIMCYINSLVIDCSLRTSLYSPLHQFIESSGKRHSAVFFMLYITGEFAALSVYFTCRF